MIGLKINSNHGEDILYLSGKGDKPGRRVLSTDDLFDTLERLHKVEADHTGRTRLYKRASQEFFGVTEKICGIYVKTCSVCYLKKSKKSIKSVVVKPISSRDYHCRGQVDLCDMSDLNLQANLSPDGVTPYKYLLVYLDHFTKKVISEYNTDNEDTGIDNSIIYRPVKSVFSRLLSFLL